MEFTLWQRFVAVLLAICLHAIVLISINYSRLEETTAGLEGFHVSVTSMSSFAPEESVLTEETPIEEIEAVEMIEEVEEVEIVEVDTLEQVDAVEVIEIEPEPVPVEAPTVLVQQKKKVEKKAVAKKNVEQVKNPNLASGVISDTGKPKKAETSYKAIISAILQKHKRYPSRALRRKQEGTVAVVFMVKKNGSLAKYEITDSSGYELLDQAVEEMLKSATPFPPFPSDVKKESITLLLPVDFIIESYD